MVHMNTNTNTTAAAALREEIDQIKAWQRWAREHPYDSVAIGQADAAADRLTFLEAELQTIEASDQLQARYIAWQARREELSAQESEGHYPAPGDWHDSDDDGIELLRQVAAALWGAA
jgi:hypothetical protein